MAVKKLRRTRRRASRGQMTEVRRQRTRLRSKELHRAGR